MRLSHRLTIVFSAFGLAIAGGLQYNHVRELRVQSYALTRNMTEVTSSAVRSMVENQAKTGSLSRLGSNLEEMVRQIGVATIVVRDRKGRRLVGRSDDPKWVTREPHPGVPIEKVSDGIYDVEHPVDIGPWGRGTVQIGYHTSALEEHLRDIGQRAVRSGVMAFLAVALLAWLMGTWFGLRIEHSEAGLYLWATADEHCRTTVDRLADRGVLVAPGEFYGPAGTAHVRVAATATEVPETVAPGVGAVIETVGGVASMFTVRLTGLEVATFPAAS